MSKEIGNIVASGSKESNSLAQERDVEDVFVEALAAVLKERRMKKSEFARQIGITHQTLNIYFRKDRLPNVPLFVKMCTVLQVAPEKLLGLKWKDDAREYVLEWKLFDDITGGGYRIVWKCHRCGEDNLEPLDEEFNLLDKVERSTNYQSRKIELILDIAGVRGLMCEVCGQFYRGIKGKDLCQLRTQLANGAMPNARRNGTQ